MQIHSHSTLEDHVSAAEQAHNITALLNEADIGIAVFDENRRLLSSNPAYREIRNLPDDVFVVGTSHKVLTQSTLRKDGFSEAEATEVYTTDMKRLEAAGEDRINANTAICDNTRIHRILKPSGLLVETITTKVDAKPADNVPKSDTGKTYLIGRKRWAAAVDKMADGFAVFDPDGTIVAINQRYRELSPHIADDLYLGAHHEDIVRAAYRSGAVNLGDQSEEEFLAFAKSQLEQPSHDTVDQLKNGRWIRFSGRKLDDGSTVFLQSDITALKNQEAVSHQAAKDLENTTELLKAAVENMFAGFVMFDADHKMVMHNEVYNDIFQFPKDVLQPGVSRVKLIEVAKELKLFADNYEEKSAEQFKTSLNNDQPSLNRYYMRDGRIIQVRHAPMGAMGSIALFLDITAEQDAKTELISNNEKLQNSNSELQNFAYVASHDLQEPLRKIEAFGDRLVRKYHDDLPEDGQMYLDRIQNSANRMRQLINDLLSFSRVTSNAKEFQSTSLQDVLAGVVDDMAVALEDKQADIWFSDLPEIDADPTQMRQLFQNIISNALKFAKSDVAPVIKIEASSTQHQAVDGRWADMAVLTIKDNGIGFDNRYKDQIFAIFQRLHGRMEYEGTGIGLATCRKIVERHNGTIDADGVDGEGATFTIELPVKNSTGEN